MSDAGWDVLGLGVVAVDELLYVDAYPPADAKIRIRNRARQCGGLTGTALVAAARVSARCAYGGILGDEDLSRFVRESFLSEGIDLSPCTPCAEARPAHSTIIVDQTHKTRTIFAGLDGPAGPADDQPSVEAITAARAILIDHHGIPGSLRAAKIARENGIAVVADFERDPGGDFSHLVDATDHLVLSQRFARQWTGKKDPLEAAAALWRPDRAAVVVTCGEAGCWYLDASMNGRPCHKKAFPVETLDTTGCGDVFHGVYAAATAWGWELPRRVEFASAAAALKAMHRGGQAGCPTLAQIETFLNSRSWHPHTQES